MAGKKLPKSIVAYRKELTRAKKRRLEEIAQIEEALKLIEEDPKAVLIARAIRETPTL